MKLYPIFASLRDRSVLVVGGGDVAERKCRSLLGTGARIVVGSPALNEQLSRWLDAKLLRHYAGEFKDSWLDGMWLVIAATDNDDVNRRVASAAAEHRVFANVVDDRELSTFQVPAIIDRAPLQIAISSAGSAPMLARRVRERIETLLDHSLGPLAALLDRARRRIRLRFRVLGERRALYTRIIDGNVARLLRAGKPQAAQEELNRVLREPRTPRLGSVVLVGAGPGDPGLLTLRALRALNEADVILHDRLVSSEILELARRDAAQIEVGKQSGNHHVTQEQIHALMLEHARAGRRVVRLKGGDPFIFGRGGEEMVFLRRHAISYEVVPGVTAALACAAYAGIPLTHRDHAQSVQFLTAHRRESFERFSPGSLEDDRQTLAIYMGIAQLPALRRQLLDAGRLASTPVAIVENGTRNDQRVILTAIDDLDRLAERHDLQSPALVIVGDVAALAQQLAWFGSAPVIDADLRRSVLPKAAA